MSDLFKGAPGQSLFANPIALDYDYQPKMIPYREAQQKQIAACIKPLFQKRNGRNIIVYGPTGVGKTVAVRHILQELEDESDDIIPVYVNCWQRNTTFKILLEMCDILNYKFTQNKRTEELFAIVKQQINRSKSAVFVFDEADKLEDLDFLYQILEEVYRKTLILITNHKEWVAGLDQRIKSRLNIEMLEFAPYNAAETAGILQQRAETAFARDALARDAFELICRKAGELGDIRKGLYLLKETADCAEESSSGKMTIEHAQKAISKLDKFTINSTEALDGELKVMLDAVRQNSGKKIGEIYRAYQEQGGSAAYKTFQRSMQKLESGKFITTQKTSGGNEGNTTLIRINEGDKKLTEF